MKTLCIGGVADGRRVEDAGRDYVQIPSLPLLFQILEHTSFDTEVLVSTYRREVIRSGRDEIAFYVHEEMDTDDAIRQLFRRYPTP